MSRLAYASRDFYTYEVDYDATLSPGQSIQLPINVSGDSDFFWQKFSAFALAAGAATTRSADQLPALSMSVLNQTTGRQFMNTPVALPNMSGYGQFLPQMAVWPRKSLVLVTLENEDPATTVDVTSGFGFDSGGLGSSGEDVTFLGYNNPTVPGGAGAVGSITPTTLFSQTLLVVGMFSGFGSNIFYVITAAGAQTLFSSVTTQIGAGPVTTYEASAAVFLPNGQSGSINAIPITSTAGSLWLWNDPSGTDFVDGEETVLEFSPPASPTSYSLLQLSFMGTKAYPRVIQ